MEFSITFVQLFFWGVYLAAPILLMLCTLIIIVGQVVGRLEGWGRFNALYWSFITALTVGYGDIRPMSKLAKVLAIVIAFLGIMLTGIFVAITVATASSAFHQSIDPIVLKGIEERFK
ncbi:two pore domain potassium channel family protein [Pontibacterium sp. N1Y112]|uniref:Two pore domain potassium channel family protein n=1 Tax=Pontibacterium sinense TaxID=2781979 RepID=A0A8J7FHF1_9GAMM|nr:potassium channel family protein [Pontibacterium sinense]MBE9399411.1 two pore domain potassium channel family protein [Pontibacterium sinense]